MKKTKVLILSLCVVALIAATVLGTLAYLTDSSETKNTFTVGKVDITLDETDVDEDGVPVPGADRVAGNEYHLVPGQTYVKDPTVTVLAGSEESYVRMLVTINEISALQSIFGTGFLPENYVSGWDNTVWAWEKTGEVVNDTITYEFRYFETVDASEATEDVMLDALFDTFTLPGEITGEQLAAISDLEIIVVGHAIQSAGFADADAAWAAFDAQVNA